MSDHLTHIHHIPGPLPGPEAFLCAECQADAAEASGQFMAERSEARHQAYLASLTEAEHRALTVASMALGEYLESCLCDYADEHPEQLLSYGLIHAALRYLYWMTEREMLQDDQDDEEETP